MESQPSRAAVINIRGGVEGTRPYKAKDTKNPTPRTVLPRTDPLEAKDRNARGQDQGPRIQAQVLSKKKVFKIFFQIISKKEVYKRIFQAIYKILTIQKIVLSSSRGQTIFEGSRLRGQELDLRGQGQDQGPENVFSRQRTFSRTPPLINI